jgi:hypothetical protein
MTRSSLLLAVCKALALSSVALAVSAAAAPTESDSSAASPMAASPMAAERLTALPVTLPAKGADTKPGVWVSETFGVEVQGAHLSANGYVIDMRYRVVDGDKAKPLLDRRVQPVLVDEASGNRFYVPQPPIVGALRQTARNNVAAAVGKTYFMIFANPDQRLKAGSSVALYIGDQRFGNLRIEP